MWQFGLVTKQAIAIIVSLMYALKHHAKKRGVAALCIGGGEALAVAIEML